MKYIEVVVSAEATIEETWTLRVPDDIVVDEENALDMIDQWQVHVTDRAVDNERDRQVVSVDDGEQPPVDATMLNEFIRDAGLETRLAEYVQARTALQEGWR